MSITVTDSKNGDDLDFQYSKEELERVADAVLFAIQTRTLEGKSADAEKKFKDYTPDYAKQKGSNFVNLYATGETLRSMEIKITRTGFRIILPDDEQEKALGNEKNGRSFMGFTKSTLEAMDKAIIEILDEKLKLNSKRGSRPRRSI